VRLRAVERELYPSFPEFARLSTCGGPSDPAAEQCVTGADGGVAIEVRPRWTELGEALRGAGWAEHVLNAPTGSLVLQYEAFDPRAPSGAPPACRSDLFTVRVHSPIARVDWPTSGVDRLTDLYSQPLPASANYKEAVIGSVPPLPGGGVAGGPAALLKLRVVVRDEECRPMADAEDATIHEISMVQSPPYLPGDAVGSRSCETAVRMQALQLASHHEGAGEGYADADEGLLSHIFGVGPGVGESPNAHAALLDGTWVGKAFRCACSWTKDYPCGSTESPFSRPDMEAEGSQVEERDLSGVGRWDKGIFSRNLTPTSAPTPESPVGAPAPTDTPVAASAPPGSPAAASAPADAADVGRRLGSEPAEGLEQLLGLRSSKARKPLAADDGSMCYLYCCRSAKRMARPAHAPGSPSGATVGAKIAQAGVAAADDSASSMAKAQQSMDRYLDSLSLLHEARQSIKQTQDEVGARVEGAPREVTQWLEEYFVAATLGGDAAAALSQVHKAADAWKANKLSLTGWRTGSGDEQSINLDALAAWLRDKKEASVPRSVDINSDSHCRAYLGATAAGFPVTDGWLPLDGFPLSPTGQVLAYLLPST